MLAERGLERIERIIATHHTLARLLQQHQADAASSTFLSMRMSSSALDAPIAGAFTGNPARCSNPRSRATSAAPSQPIRCETSAASSIPTPTLLRAANLHKPVAVSIA